MGWPAPHHRRKIAAGEEERIMTKTMIAMLGIDLGKNSCSLAGLDAAGAVVLRRRATREGVLKLTASLPPCVVAMEACCGAHHIGRVLREQGHEVRLMPPEYVQPYVKAQKNDERDAEAIAEAATRPTMRFVELKSEAQLDMQILHRARTRLVGERTALINQLRALLLERGIVVARGRQRLEASLVLMLDDAAATPPCTLSSRTLLLIADMRQEWRELDRRIAALTAEFVARAREDIAARQLTTIPGFGALNATALVAAIGSGETFHRARDLAAWLGLVPRQATTGGKQRLLGITKRGNTYLRTMLVHGARAALPSLSASATGMGEWLRALSARAHKNKVIVALAGKLARIAWAVLRTGQAYNPGAAAATA
jgi:transposase